MLSNAYGGILDIYPGMVKFSEGADRVIYVSEATVRRLTPHPSRAVGHKRKHISNKYGERLISLDSLNGV